ncbi:MAG: VC_2705 family sodium/solute symporter, partial [Fimbriimonadaceae bacterium]|nr:VC_2705 family sodium/solute symporter [Alphaproteobacteria bacterium]
MPNYADSGQQTRRVGRFLGIYTSGFAAFVILITILEQIGMPANWIGYVFILVPLFVYAGIGILTRTIKVPEFYVAGRRLSALQNGMASAGEWISGGIFLSLAGSLFMLGYDGLAFILGLTGGYALIAILIAPFLRKYGAFTLPDFFAARYGGHPARLIGVTILVACSFFLIVAQIRAAGLITERFLDIPYNFAVLLALASILISSVLGGMRAVTWTLVAQYIVLMIAYIIPVLILSVQETSLPAPQIMYGQALEQIGSIEANLLQTEQTGIDTLRSYLQPFVHMSPLNFFALVFCFMLGTAGLPHILTRYFTTASVRDARVSVGWSLVFIM